MNRIIQELYKKHRQIMGFSYISVEFVINFCGKKNVPSHCVVKFVLLAASFFFSTTAKAQSINYKTIEAKAGIITQVDFFATGKRDCSAQPPPSIKVILAPKHGLLTIRRASVTTNKIPNCPNLQMPANVIFYTAKTDFSGLEEVVYEVIDVKGQVGIYNIKITVSVPINSALPSPKHSDQEL